MAGVETYYYGECTYYCARELSWVRGGWGNATDWCGNASRDGLGITGQPTVGSVVVYQAGDGYSTFGHCAIVRQLGQDGRFLVSEMNYVAWNTVDDRWSTTWDVECFILPPGTAPGLGGGSAESGGGSDAAQFAGDAVNAWEYFRTWANKAGQDQTALLDQVGGGLDDIG